MNFLSDQLISVVWLEFPSCQQIAKDDPQQYAGWYKVRKFKKLLVKIILWIGDDDIY